MEQRAAQTVREIEQTRERLGTHLQELEERLPAGSAVKRVARLAIGGGVGTTAFWFAVRRIRKRKAKTKAAAPVVQVLPEEWIRSIDAAIGEGAWKGWAAGFGAAWLVFRLSELRQLRKVRVAMLTR